MLKALDVNVGFVPAYCLTVDKSTGIKRLTHMSLMCVREACAVYRRGIINHIIFGCAYEFWEDEARLVREEAVRLGVSVEMMRFLEAVTDRFDEARKLKIRLGELLATSLYFWGEASHLRKNFRKSFCDALPGIRIYFFPLRCQVFERALEPSRIKSLRASHGVLWRLWNWLVDKMTPLYLRRWPL